MTLKDALDAMDKEEFHLDELLLAVLEECSTCSNQNWYSRTLLDTLSLEDLKREIHFRENAGGADPFYP
jgi:hypothetical protein